MKIHHIVWLMRAVLAILLTATPALQANESHDPGRSHYLAPMADMAPVVDGVADDGAWESASWRKLDNIWLGEELSDQDFSGRYKVVWTKERLYLLVEFVDDVLVDFHRNPLEQYWDDDCLEVFIDEDFSGGDHQYNHNAFAYHISLDNQAIDIGTDRQPRSYSDHVQSRWRQKEDKVTWEVAIQVYTDQYEDDKTDNRPKTLAAGKIMGFMVAYCDNDHSELREHFIGSEFAAGDHKDRGWKDAGLFGKLELVD
jgi:hypothetical protein